MGLLRDTRDSMQNSFGLSVAAPFSSLVVHAVKLFGTRGISVRLVSALACNNNVLLSRTKKNEKDVVLTHHAADRFLHTFLE